MKETSREKLEEWIRQAIKKGFDPAEIKLYIAPVQRDDHGKNPWITK